MSGIWFTSSRPVFGGWAGGEATLGDIYQATLDSEDLVRSTVATANARERAYDERNTRIFDLTGEKLDNPYRVGWQGVEEQALARQRGTWQSPLQVAEDDWRAKLRVLAARRPELANDLLPATSIDDEAIALNAEARQRAERLAGSRTGLGKWLAVMAGSGVGWSRDPVQAATMLLGGWAGPAKSIAGRILFSAASEAAVNAGVELAIDRMTTDWRAKGGDDVSWSASLRSALFAGLLGGVVGGAGRGIVEALAHGGRSGQRAAANVADDLPPALKQEIERTLPDATAALREALPPTARGAVDALETTARLEEARPASALPDHHELTMGRAAAALERESPASLAPDPAQISRIADDLVGRTPKAQKSAPSLVEFLKAKGGIVDQNGELAAIGAESLARPRKGKAALPLDAAREAAEEAGYIGRAGETQVTTVRDLLDAVDQELRGQPVFSRADDAPARGDYDAERARVESRIQEVAQHAGPAVDDAIVREAAEISLRDGVEAFDALERVYTRLGMADEAGPAEIITIDATRGVDAPGDVAVEDMFISERDLATAETDGFTGAMPFFDDEPPMTVAALRDALAADNQLQLLVKACRA